MQPQNANQWNLRYLISEAIRNGAEISLDANGNVLTKFDDGPLQLLTEQTSSRVATDGKRRGFNGKQPRLTDGQSHPCYVTTADGREYVFTRKSRKTNVQLRDEQALIRKLAPSNGGNPDA